jgi:hypothetical protein
MRSIRICLYAFLATALVLSIHGFAKAQIPLVTAPSAVSVGLFLPSSSDAKNAGGSSQLYVSAQYGLPVNVPLTPTRTVVTLEGEFGTHGGQHSNIIPLTIGEYVGASGKSAFASQNVYAGIGAGVYLENIGSDSSTGQVGGYGVIGYNIGAGFFVQAKYQVVKSANGPIVSVGSRF